MTVAIEKEASGKVLLVHASDKLTREDYNRFVPEIENLVRQYGKIRILFNMRDFRGWTAGALWEDAKYGVKHFAHIERVAMVGDKAWQHGMALFCKPFTRAKVRYFDHAEADAARQWLEAGLPVAHESVASGL